MLHTHFFGRRFLILTSKVGKTSKTSLVLVCNEGSLIGLCMQDYKSLCIAVTSCATMVYPNFDFYILTLKSKSC